MNKNKLIALATVLCFLHSSIIAPAVRATLVPADVHCRPQQNDCPVPAGAGRITSARDFGSDTMIVNIQDLHCHPEVQRNIAKILAALDKAYGLDKIYVEGGYGDVSTSWLCDLKDAAAKKQIAENLLEQGRLTGTEYYSVLSGRPDLLKGMENRALHRENVIRLEQILANRNRYETRLRELERELGFMKTRYLGAQHRRFDDLVARHRKNEIAGDNYYESLIRYAAVINGNPDKYAGLLTIDMADYPNITAFVELSHAAKRMNYRRITRQLQAFLPVLKSRIAFSDYQSLLNKTDNLSNADALYLPLAQLAKSAGLRNCNGKRFADLYRFFDYVEKHQALNPVLLIEEEKRLIGEIRIALSGDTAELEISFLSDFFDCFRDYLLNRLSAADYEYFTGSFDEFKRIWGNYASRNRLEDLAGDFVLLDAFYKTNDERNKCFMDAVAAAARPGTSSACTGATTVAANARLFRNRRLIVMVTGGFHTEGLGRIFSERHLSHLTITPNITQDTSAAAILYAGLAEKQAAVFARQALALALGSTAAKVVSVTGDTIVVRLNDEEITLSRTGGRRFRMQSPAQFLKYGQAFETAVNEALSMAKAIESLDNPPATADLIIRLAESFSVIAARNGVFGGNGLIWEIATDKEVQDTIYRQKGISPEELDLVGDTMQKIIENDAKRMQALENAARQSPLMNAIAGAPGLARFMKTEAIQRGRKQAEGGLDEAFTEIDARIAGKKKHSREPFFILIAGKSASGKSSQVSEKLAARYNARIINLDDYYLRKEDRELLGVDNFDDPRALDWNLLKEHLGKLRNRETIEIPRYAFEKSDRDGTRGAFTPGDVIILEGLFPLQDEIAAEGDYNIFVDVDRLGQLLRRLVRDAKEKGNRTGQSLAEILLQMLTQVVPAEKQFTEPTKKNADIIIRQNYAADEEAPRIGLYELQAKARLHGADEETLRQKLAELKAEKLETVEQSDRYYRPADKDLRVTGETVRIRKENGDITLTYKGPAMDSALRYRPNLGFTMDEKLETPLKEDYIPGTEINKRRTTYRLPGEILLHLDVVEGLGAFAEIATWISKENRTDSELAAEVRKAESAVFKLFDVLQIPREQLTRDTYETLALAAQGRTGAQQDTPAAETAADENAPPTEWFHSPTRDIWVRSGPLKITDPGVKEAAAELGINLWWNDDGRIGRINFYDAKRLLNRLGGEMMSPREYWEVLKDAADAGDTAMVKELTSNRYAEWLDVLFYEEDGNQYTVEHPTIKPDGTWDREADAGRVHPIKLPRGRYGWLHFDNLRDVFSVISRKTGFPLEGAVQKQHARKGITFKYWDIYDGSMKKGVIRGYVTSSGTPSLDAAMPLDVPDAPFLEVRAYRRTAPEAGFDPELLQKFDALERAYNEAMENGKYNRFYDRKDELFEITGRLLTKPENIERLRNSQDNTFIKLREKLADMLGFVQINALQTNDRGALDQVTRQSVALFGVQPEQVSYDGFVSFVQSGRSRLQQALTDKKRIVFVMGHRSPDTDTVISSLFEAYRNQLINPSVAYVPVVQADRIPKEVRLLLDNDALSNGILLETDPLYAEAGRSGQANWVLVDQNVSRVQKFVISILDHHAASEAALRQDVAKTIEIVGSTTGMVVQRFLGEGLRLDERLSRIAYGATLMDTENMSKSKMTFKDEVLMKLLRTAAKFDGADWKAQSTAFYQKLMDALLSTNDAQLLFDRDYKEDWGFGFAVAKLKGMFDTDGNVLNRGMLDAFEDLARRNNERKHLPLTLVKVVDYAGDNETVNRERLYFVFGDDAQPELKNEIFRLFEVILNNEFGNSGGLHITVDRKAGYVEWSGVGTQLSRKKVAPLLQPVVQAFNKYFYSGELGIYVSRDFLKPDMKTAAAAKKLHLALSTNTDGYVNYLSPQEIMLLMKEMGYSIMTLKEYAIVREEAKEKNDLEMLASLESHGFVEVLSTVVMNYHPETGDAEVIEHPDVTKDSDGNFKIQGVRKKINIPRAEPGLIEWDKVDKTTGLPSKIFYPGKDAIDPATEYARYWSPGTAAERRAPGTDSAFVFTRGSIFIYKITCMDGKVPVYEAHPNLGARFYRKEIAVPLIRTRIIDGKIVTDIQDEGVLQRYRNGKPELMPYTDITGETARQLMDVDATKHTLDLMPYVEANVPPAVLEAIKERRIGRVEIHYGPQDFVTKKNPGLLKGYADHSMRDPDAARIGWYMKQGADGKAEVIITDVRGTTKILHLLYVLRFLGVNEVPVYDYHFDFEKFAEEAIAAGMNGEKPGIVAVGKSIFERKLLRKVKYALIFRQIEKEMEAAHAGGVREFLRAQLLAAGTKEIDGKSLDAFFAVPFVKETLDKMQSITDEHPDMRTLLTYWYYGDIVEDYIRILTTLNTNTIEITKFAKMLQKDLRHVSVSEEGVVTYPENGKPVSTDLSGILSAENGKKIVFRASPDDIAAPARLHDSLRKIYNYVFAFSGRLSRLNDYSAGEPQKLFIPKVIDPDVIGMHLLQYPVDSSLLDKRTAVVGRYPFGTLAADFVLAGAKRGASTYVHAGSAGLFFKDLDEIKTFRLRQADLIIPERVFSKEGRLLTDLEYQPLLNAATDILQRSKRPYRVLRRENGGLRVVDGLRTGENPDDLINIVLTDHIVVDTPLEEDENLVNRYQRRGIGSVDVETGKAVELLQQNGLTLNYRFMFWVADLPGKEGDTLASEKQLHPIADQTRMRKVQGLMSDIFLSLEMADAAKAGNIFPESGNANAGEKNGTMAIRPKNLKKIGGWAADGWRAWHIAAYIGLVQEQLFSYFRPFSFVREHPDREAAEFIVVVGWYVALMSPPFFWFTAPAFSPLIAFFAGLVAGAAAKGMVQAYIDWHFIQDSRIMEAVHEFGAATLDTKGNLHTNLYVLDKKTDDMKSWGWQNTGLHIGGKRIWVSMKANALVFFTDGENAVDLAQYVNETVSKKSGIAGGRRLVRKFAQLFRKIDADLDIAGLTPGVIIDHDAYARRMPHYENGDMFVSADYFGETPEERQKNLSVRLGDLMTIRDAEAAAMPQNIYFQLDDGINTREDIEAFNRAGNGLIVIDPEDFSALGMDKSRIRELARLYRRSGVLAAIDLSKVTGAAREKAAKNFNALGFPAYYDGEKIYVFTLNRTGIPTRTLSGYTNAATLRQLLRDAQGTAVILKLSDLKRLMKGGERTITDRVALTEILKTTVLSFYSRETLTNEYVATVGYAWDRNRLPDMPEDVAALAESIDKGDIPQILEAMGIKDKAHPVNAYLEKLHSEFAGTDNEAKLPGLQRAFLTAIAEMMLAKAELDRRGKTNGLADRRLEIVLGQNLLRHLAFPVEERSKTLPEDLVLPMQSGKPTAEDVFNALYIRVAQLSVREKDPLAINAIIELIAARAEVKIPLDQQEGKSFIDIRSVNALLQAA